MAGLLAGKVAVVTGSSKGLGRAFVMGLACEGASVVVNGTNADDVARVVSEIKTLGGKATGCVESVATMDGAKRIVQKAIDEFNRLDILVNNAGVLRDRTFMKMTEEEWNTVVSIHLKGTFACCKAAVVPMSQQNNGRIINITSAAAWLGNIGQANYCAAKAGIIGLTYNISQELERFNITVNAVRPAALTRMTIPVMEKILERAKEKALRENKPVPTLLDMGYSQPESIAPLIVFLASDEAKDINGRLFSMTAETINIMSRNEPIESMQEKGGWKVDQVRSRLLQYFSQVK